MADYNYERIIASFVLAFTVILIAVLATSLTALAGEIHVCPGGCDYAGIQAAIDSASPGDGIVVESGTYAEDLIIGKAETIQGLDTGNGRPVLADSITAAADGASLHGFEFAGPNGTDDNCIINVVGPIEIYLNNIPSARAVCSGSSAFWNSSQPINYQFESKVLRSRMGNYWADYTGEDKNLDGIGDEPMVIDGKNVDYYPLIQPVESYRIKGEKEERMELIRAKINEPFTIALNSNPTTGYKWYADYDYYLLSLEDERFEKDPSAASEALGAGGRSVFVFKPLKSGKTTVSLVYRRPWENIVADTRTFYIEIPS